MKYLIIIAFLLGACGHKTDVRLPSEVNVKPPEPVVNNTATIPDGSLPVQE